MKLLYKKIWCICLSFAIVFSLIPWINSDAFSAYATASEGLESWKASATGVSSGSICNYELTFEKDVEGEYILYIPDDIMNNANK